MCWVKTLLAIHWYLLYCSLVFTAIDCVREVLMRVCGHFWRMSFWWCSIGLSFILEVIVSTKSPANTCVPWPPSDRSTCLFMINGVCSVSGTNSRRPSVKTVVEMKWIKTMNIDPISPQATAWHTYRRCKEEIHKCKWCFGCTVVAAGHEELHIISQQAHWFLNSRMGAAFVSGKCLDSLCLFDCRVFVSFLMQIVVLFFTT